MIHIYGVILIEPTAVIIRNYEVSQNEWKLTHYQEYQLESFELQNQAKSNLVEVISVILSGYFTTDTAKHVTQWKIGAKHLTQETLNNLSATLGLEIEQVTPIREQELLCKGLFTELW